MPSSDLLHSSPEELLHLPRAPTIVVKTQLQILWMNVSTPVLAR